jgi:hypothetical protein
MWRRTYIVAMMTESFTHEVCDDPLPRRRVRISGPVYDEGSVPFLRVEYEDGDAALLPPSELLLFRPLISGSGAQLPEQRFPLAGGVDRRSERVFRGGHIIAPEQNFRL